MNFKFNNYHRTSPAFTIIELIVVIVIIGILATITIVSYFGINDKAIESSLKSQLSSASRSLKAFQVEYDNYPTTIDCTIANSSTNLCLKPGDNATYTYQVDNTADPQTFKLYVQSQLNSKIFLITNDAEPIGVDSMEIDEKWTQVSANSHACGIISGTTAYCWGNNGNGQLGNNSTVKALVPTIVDTSVNLSGKNITAISVGGGHTCAVASDNKAYCWGWNSSGQLGNNSTTSSLIPVAVYVSGALSGKTVSTVDNGNDFTCTIASDGKVYCWGNNNVYQLGNGGTTVSSVPVAVSTSGVLSGKTIKAVSTGYGHACVIASDDKAYCWGFNSYGQLGNNSTTNSSVPVAVNTSGVLSGKTIKAISAGYYHTCAIASDDQAYCWGYNAYGQLGNNSTTNSSVPVAVNTSGVLSGKTVTVMSSRSNHACVVASDNKAYCWGYNSKGQLGNNSTTNSSVPVAVDISNTLKDKNISMIATGNQSTCAITLGSSNQLHCWGYNGQGILGNDSTTDSLVSVRAVYPGS